MAPPCSDGPGGQPGAQPAHRDAQASQDLTPAARGGQVLEPGTVLLTLKDGTDLPPGCDATLAGVLAQRCLQEEDGNATGEEEDEVGDEEGTCGQKEGDILLVVHVPLLP